jgi:hypothetical protein
VGRSPRTASFPTTNFSVNVPAENISFAPGSLTLFGLISAPATIIIDGPMTGPFGGPYQQTPSVPLTSTVNLLGFKCSLGPFTPVLTTGTSGSLTGTPLTGSLTAQSGTLVANAFTVPAIHPSSTCPAILRLRLQPSPRASSAGGEVCAHPADQPDGGTLI